MADKSRKKNLFFLIPIAVAVVTVIVMGISGNSTRVSDQKNPTGTTAVSLANEDEAKSDSTKQEDSKVTLLAVGDNLIHNTLISAGENSDGTRDYTSLYANIKPEIESADISIIDQETVLGGSAFEYTGYPIFNTPWEVGDAAIKAGFDIFTCANNHILDKGYKGIEKEKEFFSKYKNVVQIGTNLSEEEYNQITYYEKNGITFSLLNYTASTNGIDLPEGKSWCVDVFDKDKMTKDIKEARANSDVVIVFPHWGTENSHKIDDFQKKYVQLFSSLGVDIVIGCHPHVLQPVEWVTNQSTGKKMLVYYSLGNFISHQIELDQLCGGMAKITVEKHGNKIEISSAKLVPIVTHYYRGDSRFVFDVYKLGDYTDELASTHSQNGGTVEYYTKMVKSVVDEQFISMK